MEFVIVQMIHANGKQIITAGLAIARLVFGRMQVIHDTSHRDTKITP
jgi:hypothetical protein